MNAAAPSALEREGMMMLADTETLAEEMVSWISATETPANEGRATKLAFRLS